MTHDQLDALILATAKSSWRKVAMIIGKVGYGLEGMNQAIEDERIAERIQALANAGCLESKGNISHPRHSEVRSPVPDLGR
jgi:hypothetical protein